MAISPKYQTAQPAVASYDYFDIEDGTGIQVYYAYAASGAVLTRGLSRNQVQSDPRATTTAGANAIDLDFDVTFNRPQIIEGTALMVVPEGVTGDQANAWLTFTIRKVVGGVETDLVSVSGALMLTSGSGVSQKLNVVEATIPKTAFKATDVLRLNIGSRVGQANWNHWISHDPTGTAVGKNPVSGAIVNNGTMEFHVPFKVDIGQ